MEDLTNFPINYNHYYTDTIQKRRQERQKVALTESLESATEHTHPPGCTSNHTSARIDIDKALNGVSALADSNMENFSYEEILDSLFAIYKISQKNFITNITTQVIERHIFRDLEKIFSPVVVNGMSDAEIEAIASEPTSAKTQRAFLEDRIGKLKDGQAIFRGVMGTSSK